MKKINYLIVVLIGIVVIFLCYLVILKHKEDLKNPVPQTTYTPIDISNTSDFDYKIIKETNNLYNNKNYMISPLSMAYALSMVRDGADGQTKEQLDNLLGDYILNTKIGIKDKIGIANLIFIKNTYKNDISNEYMEILKTNHDSEVLFDEFKTPKAINDWISRKTFNMIKDPLKDISPDFVLGLANAIAIDIEWQNKFECNRTTSETFIKDNNTKIDVAMMHSTNDITYIENDNAKGIIKDYAIYDKTTGEVTDKESVNTVSLEYIAILPNTNINEYLKIFDKDELNSLLSNKKTSNENLDINLSLPKYTYDFDYDEFKKALINLGMVDAFDSSKANFKKMINENSDLEIYINKAIHKSHIELSENGTKAAAVTIFTFDKNAVIDKKDRINITFDKPFIYLIREKNTNNIWFFGTVFEPMLWKDNDIKNCDVK